MQIFAFLGQTLFGHEVFFPLGDTCPRQGGDVALRLSDTVPTGPGVLLGTRL